MLLTYFMLILPNVDLHHESDSVREYALLLYLSAILKIMTTSLNLIKFIKLNMLLK